MSKISAHQVLALLGPTNTGKTHMAVERMLSRPSGMIGLPLRLLAREIYDRVVVKAGEVHTALVTGEEKIIPAQPRYWICTVEAMPLDIQTAFVAIDEVQLAADPGRGHVFTDRILHARGNQETWLLGAETIRSLLQKLLPKIQFSSRPRFSKLTYAGEKKITRLPRRSAVVGFSGETVYSLAELIRRQRGGTAVVLGALSPRTRNAQVELYQSGDVDYLVATDAIGMGLNMDVDHIAFAADRKFDGFRQRLLTAAELGQIAGRAGRYMRDGTFGVTAGLPSFDGETIERLESHQFEPLKMVQWRNRNLSFKSLDHLRASLNAMPNREGLTRARSAVDVEALEFLSRDEAVRSICTSSQSIELLWQVCQLPDYRNITAAEHAALTARIFGFLTKGDGFIPEDWINRQLMHCAQLEGDIDTLSNRISHVRTWTFLTNRPDWLKDAGQWQEKARAIEDRLSDALHERLIQQFIDRRTMVLLRRLREKGEFMASIEDDGKVFVEGDLIGEMKGFRFWPSSSSEAQTPPLKSAIAKLLAGEVALRAQAVAATPDPELSLTADGAITWRHHEVARLTGSGNPLQPRIEILADDHLQPEDRQAVQARLEKFLARHITNVFGTFDQLDNIENLTGLARGLIFRLQENFGIVPREDIAQEVKSLSQQERAPLRKAGIRFGAFHIFIPVLLKPAASELRLLLWYLHNEKAIALDFDALPAVPGQGLTSAIADPAAPQGFYQTAGFRLCGSRIVRIDMLERLADMIRQRVFWRPEKDDDARPKGSIAGGGFSVVPDMMSLVGCSGDDFNMILNTLGFRCERRKIENAEPTALSPQEEADVTAQTQPAGDEAAEPQPAEQVLEVWWPRNTGPFGRSNSNAKQRPPRKKSRQAQNQRPARKKQDAGANRPDKRSRRQASVAKPEDSPFAVLQDLKKQLVDKD